MAMDLSHVNWQAGTIGQWVAGVGTVFLAAVSIWIVRRERRSQQRMRAQRFFLTLSKPSATEEGGWTIGRWSVDVGVQQEGLSFYEVQVTLNIRAVGKFASEPLRTVTAARRQADFLDGSSMYHEKTWRELAEATATFRDVDEVWWSVVADGGKLKRLRKVKTSVPSASVEWVR